MGLTTDVGGVALLLLYSARLINLTRIYISNRANSDRRGVLFNEIWLAAQLTIPAFIFLTVRLYAQQTQSQLLSGVAPYTGATSNLFDPHLWWINLMQMARQFGLLLPVAAGGFWLCLKGPRASVAVLSLVLLIGLGGLYITYVPETVGMARHNLMLLPPLIVPAWEALTASRKRRSLFGLLIGLLLAANLLMNRVTPDGDRLPWPGMGEQWYQYRAAFEAVKQADPQARLALLNMTHGYAHWWLEQSLGWRPISIVQYRPPAPHNQLQNLGLSLGFAAQNGDNFAIYRQEQNQPEIPQLQTLGFREVARYESRSGVLILYKRCDPLEMPNLQKR